VIDGTPVTLEDLKLAALASGKASSDTVKAEQLADNCVGAQTWEFGRCVDPDCSFEVIGIEGQSAIEGVCACAVDNEVSPVTSACFACPTGQVFGDTKGVCVCTNDWLVPFEDSCVCAVDKEEFEGACFTPCDGGREFKSAADGVTSGDCACPVGSQFSETDGECITCPSGQEFGDTEGVCVCTNNCGCPSDKKFNFVDGSCVSFVTGIYFLLIRRWWV
jgi:hypothetical protein